MTKRKSEAIEMSDRAAAEEAVRAILKSSDDSVADAPVVVGDALLAARATDAAAKQKGESLAASLRALTDELAAARAAKSKAEQAFAASESADDWRAIEAASSDVGRCEVRLEKRRSEVASAAEEANAASRALVAATMDCALDAVLAKHEALASYAADAERLIAACRVVKDIQRDVAQRSAELGKLREVAGIYAEITDRSLPLSFAHSYETTIDRLDSAARGVSGAGEFMCVAEPDASLACYELTLEGERVVVADLGPRYRADATKAREDAAKAAVEAEEKRKAAVNFCNAMHSRSTCIYTGDEHRKLARAEADKVHHARCALLASRHVDKTYALRDAEALAEKAYDFFMKERAPSYTVTNDGRLYTYTDITKEQWETIEGRLWRRKPSAAEFLEKQEPESVQFLPGRATKVADDRMAARDRDRLAARDPQFFHPKGAS